MRNVLKNQDLLQSIEDYSQFIRNHALCIMICFGILVINLKENYYYDYYGIANYKSEVRQIQNNLRDEILLKKHDFLK